MATRDPNCPAGPNPQTREELADAVEALWESQRGWIPGGAIGELSVILGRPLRTAQEISRAAHAGCSLAYRDCPSQWHRYDDPEPED